MPVQRSILPRGDERIRAHLVLFGVLSFLASALAILLAVGSQFAADYGDRLQGSATVVVHGGALESPDAAAARADEILNATAGVARAWVLEPHSSDALIAGLIEGKLPSGAKAAPQLIAVEFRPGTRPDTAALGKRLATERLPASVDDHSVWTSRLWRLSAIVLLLVAVAWIILLVSAFAVIGAATRRCLVRRGDIIELLHLSGASDRLIANLFRFRLGALAASAAVSGAGAAVIAAVAWRYADFTSLAWRDLAAAVLWPAIAVAIAVGAATVSTRAVLKHQS